MLLVSDLHVEDKPLTAAAWVCRVQISRRVWFGLVWFLKCK